MAASIACRNILLRISTTSQRQIRRCLNQTTQLTNSEVRRKRNEMFEEERLRQLKLLSRIEKIQVDVNGPPENCTLIMNKGISTPFNCAMHIQELLMTRSALALVNGEPWDMHRPLTSDCSLEFLHFQDEDPRIVNNAFWRSCSLILGHVLETALQDQYYVELNRFPHPFVKSGSFIYDADLKVPDWEPTSAELNCLSRIGFKLHHQDLKFERLEVDGLLAEKIFKENKFKSEQIPEIVESSGSSGKVVLYRVGEHVDICPGPCISSTSQIGRFNVTAVHKIDSEEYGKLYRVQGCALPLQITMHYWSYDVLCQRSAKLNNAQIPGQRTESTRLLEESQEASS